MIDLHFEESSHTYTLNGRRVPSVTQVLDPLIVLDGIPWDVLEAARIFGNHVHLACHLYNLGTLDWDSLDPVLASYVRGYVRFLTDTGFIVLASEERVASVKMGYAGTLDLFGRLDGEAALIDAKRTVAVPRSVGPQTAGYEQAVRESHPDAVAQCASGPGDGRINRYALHLRADGSWRLVPKTDPNDARVFLAALTLHNYLEEAA